MASLRDFTENPLWKAMFVRGMYGQKETNSRYYDPAAKSTTYVPVYINANDRYSVNVSRYCSGPCAYDTGLVQPQNYAPGTHAELEFCTDSTGDPTGCADAVLGGRVMAPGRPSYRPIDKY